MEQNHKKFISLFSGFKLVGIIILVLGIIGVGYFLNRNASRVDAEKPTQLTPKSSSRPIQTNPPIASQQINKSFDFPVNDAQGRQITTIKYVVQSADLQNQIVVKGQTATAIAGRAFLIINLKLTNNSDKDIQINTRDYLRLTVNGNDTEHLAPDIYNDPVDVQAISTKYTRAGFAINTTDKNLKLYVGEISGDKTPIQLNLQ